MRPRLNVWEVPHAMGKLSAASICFNEAQTQRLGSGAGKSPLVAPGRASMRPRLNVWEVSGTRKLTKRWLSSFNEAQTQRLGSGDHAQGAIPARPVASMRPRLNVWEVSSHHKSSAVKELGTPFRATPEFGPRPERCSLSTDRKCRIPLYIHPCERSRQILCRLASRTLIASQTPGIQATRLRSSSPVSGLGSQADAGS